MGEAPTAPRRIAKPKRAPKPKPLAAVAPKSPDARLTGQAKAIWDFLKTGQWIDDPIAREKFSCRRLGARIWDIKAALKEAGWPTDAIEREMVPLLSGACVAQYRLRAEYTVRL